MEFMEVVIITITDPTTMPEFQFCLLGGFLLFGLLLSFLTGKMCLNGFPIFFAGIAFKKKK